MHVGVDADRAYSRRELIERVRAHMDRVEPSKGPLRNQRFPVLVVEGFRGVGKSDLLKELEGLLDQRVPHARSLNFEAVDAIGEASVPEVLSALAIDLGRKCPRYRALGFRRFVTGQIVMSLALDPHDPGQARREITAALGRPWHVDEIVEILVSGAGAVLQALPRVGHAAGGALLRTLGKWVAAWVAKKSVLLRNSYRWYGDQDQGLRHDPVDVLLDLNRWAKNPEHAQNRQRIDELLWAAFLADLRTDFTSGWRCDGRSLNGVVLLDNVDTPLGRRFLNELVRSRRQRVDDDPLTVVATSRGALLAAVPDADMASATQATSHVGEPVSATPRSGGWWRRHRLSDLTEHDVGRAVSDLALGEGNNQRLSQVLYQVTGGHPGATRLALEVVVSHGPEDRTEPEALLGQVPGVTSSDSPTVEDQMLGMLLSSVSDDTERDLETCSAARERWHFSPAIRTDLLLGSQALYTQHLSPILWPGNDAAGPVLLRRLLRRRLAGRPDFGDLPCWSDVYTRLRDARRAEDDEVSELYYALANGELGLVTRRLQSHLTELGAGRWFELLASVTAAPRRHRPRDSADGEARALAEEAGLEESLLPLGRLVASLWILADPFLGRHRKGLHLLIAVCSEHLAETVPSELSDKLLKAADAHRHQAEGWD